MRIRSSIEEGKEEIRKKEEKEVLVREAIRVKDFELSHMT